MEIFIGDAGDPNITSPVEAQLNDMVGLIAKTSEQAVDLQREQKLQHDREVVFRRLSSRINANVLKWAFFQVLILGGAALYQVHHLRRFFKSKKLV